MKILQLTAENIKRIKVVNITPEGDLVQVTGKNGQGKTSVLDCIWWCLANARSVQEVPIRNGSDKGRVRLDLGDLIVERKFTKKEGKKETTSVTVWNAVGAAAGTPDKKLPKHEPPRDILDALFGELAFDPFAFSRMDRRSQFDELCRISKLSVDIDALDAASKTDYALRTDIKRDAKAKRAQADGLAVPDGLPDEPIREGDLLDRIQSAGEHNASIETRKARRVQAERDITDKRAVAVRLRESVDTEQKRVKAHIAELQSNLDTFVADRTRQADTSDSDAGELETKLQSAEPLPGAIDVTDLRAELDRAKDTNTAINRRSLRDTHNAEADKLEAEADALTGRMAAREEEKLTAIKSATMPLDGLGFGDGYVTFDGLPLDQASDAEQLRVCAAISMAGNPKLKVIRIRDGSLLDEDSLKMLADMASERGYQIWIERVDSSGKVGIVMEDGMVKSC